MPIKSLLPAHKPFAWITLQSLSKTTVDILSNLGELKGEHRSHANWTAIQLSVCRLMKQGAKGGRKKQIPLNELHNALKAQHLSQHTYHPFPPRYVLLDSPLGTIHRRPLGAHILRQVLSLHPPPRALHVRSKRHTQNPNRKTAVPPPAEARVALTCYGQGFIGLEVGWRSHSQPSRAMYTVSAATSAAGIAPLPHPSREGTAVLGCYGQG